MSQEIDEAKRAANQANTTATQVNDALRPIKEQLDQWQQSYGDANTTNEDINNALMEANKTGRDLWMYHYRYDLQFCAVCVSVSPSFCVNVYLSTLYIIFVL